MKSKIVGTLLSIVLLTGCNSWKSTLVADGDENDAIMNAITDFIHTCNLRNKDTIFSINVWINDEKFIVVGIGGTDENKLYPQKEDTIGSYSRMLPSRYAVVNGKLFYWYDNSVKLSKEMADVLSEFNAIDSLNVDSVVIFNPYKIYESKKAAHYYFCKNNLRDYKKVVTNIAAGWYDPPKLKCGYPFRKRVFPPEGTKRK